MNTPRTPWCLRKRSRPSEGCLRNRSLLCHQHPSHPVFIENITRAHADASFHARIQIIGGRLFVLRGESNSSGSAFGIPAIALGPLRVYLRTLEAAVQAHSPLPDVDFVLNPVDATPAWPAFNQHAGHHHQYRVDGEVSGLSPFVIPSHEEPWRSAHDRRRITTPKWQAKRGLAAWRGSNTGFARTSISSWSGNMRARLTVLSRMHPNALDAAITAWPQPHGSAAEFGALTSFLRSAERVSPKFLSGFKYAVDVDGNVQSNRFRDLMTRDVIVLKASYFTSAYAASLHQLPHVLHVKPDLSDLVPMISCLQQHDAAALRAVRRGTAIAARLLSHTNILAYWADLIEHYASLQTFKPQKEARAVPARALMGGLSGISAQLWLRLSGDG